MPSPVIRRLLEEAHAFNFFQAVRILEAQFPGFSRPGTGDPSDREGFRLETFNSLAFPAADVAALLPPKSFGAQREDLEKAQGRELDLERPSSDLDLARLVREQNSPARLLVTFMGLYGVSSPLPSYFVDPITLRKVEYFELKKFLDYFGHRLYSLFYRAWKKYRHPVHFDPRGIDDTTLRLLALTGQWPKAKAGDTLDLKRIPFARFLGSRVRSAKGLEQLLRGYFGFSRVRVHAFAATWFDIPVRTRLGEEGALGASARLGERMEDRVSSFRVDIGPVPESEFLAVQESLWTSGGGMPLWQKIRDLIETYLRDPLFFQVRVLLAPGPGSQGPGMGSPSLRLGGYSWLGAAPREEVALRF